MSGGMRIDPKELPLPLREQVGVKIVAELAKAAPVAGQTEKRPAKKVAVKRLLFPSPASKILWQALRNLERVGEIEDLELKLGYDAAVAVVYRIPQYSKFIPFGGKVIRLSNGKILVDL